MFKSTKEFDLATRNALIRIQDEEDWTSISKSMTDDEHCDISKHILDRQYVTGIRYVSALGGGGYYGTPKLTRAGLRFIESIKG